MVRITAAHTANSTEYEVKVKTDQNFFFEPEYAEVRKAYMVAKHAHDKAPRYMVKRSAWKRQEAILTKTRKDFKS